MIAVFIGSLVTSFTEPLEYVQYRDVSYYYYNVYTDCMVTALQYKENDHEPYPRWARFVGSLLVISATLPIPSIFVIRLIWKKEERHKTTQWLINFPRRCHAAWDDFKDLFTSMKDRLVGNCIKIPFQKYTNYRSWSPDQPPYVDIHGQDSLISTHTL